MAVVAMNETLRAIDLEGYLSIIDQLTTEVYDEPHYWVTGTVAPTRDWEGLIETIDCVVGLHSLTRPIEQGEWDPYEDLPDRLMEEIPIESDGDAKRYGDWRYPAWAFTDEETTEDLERADGQLAGIAAFPENVVRTEDHRALSPGQLMDHIEELRDHYGDEWIVMTGVFGPPGGGFSMQDVGSVHRIGMTQYPAAVFNDTGIGPIGKGKRPLEGSIILHRDDVSEKVLDIVDGETEEAGPDE